MTRLNDHVTRMAELVGKIYPNDKSFVEEVNRSMEFWEGLPDRFEFDFHLDLKPEKLGAQPLEAIVNLTRNMYGWLGYFVYSNSYKVYQILATFTESLNAGKYVPVMMCARSLIEYAATIDYHGRQVEDEFSELDKLQKDSQLTKKNSLEIIKRIINIVQICHKYGRLTRFNWRAYSQGDLETFFKNWSEVSPEDRQINVLTLIDKLPQEERGARFFYEMLSDYVHPNLASHALIIDEAHYLEENKYRYVLSKHPTSSELLALVVIHTVAIPVKHSLRTVRYWIEAFKETLNKIGRWIELASSS